MKPLLQAFLSALVLVSLLGPTPEAHARKKKTVPPPPESVEVHPISRITLEVTPSATEEMGEKSAFDLKALQTSVEAELTAAGLYQPELKTQGNAMHIAVYKVEFPSKVEAIALGTFAAKNPISGNVYVTGEHGRKVRTLDVKTGHPLGHLAFRKDGKNYQKLYDAFAKRLVRDLTTKARG